MHFSERGNDSEAEIRLQKAKSHTCFFAAELSALSISTGAGAGGAGRRGGVYLDPPISALQLP